MLEPVVSFLINDEVKHAVYITYLLNSLSSESQM